MAQRKRTTPKVSFESVNWNKYKETTTTEITYENDRRKTIKLISETEEGIPIILDLSKAEDRRLIIRAQRLVRNNPIFSEHVNRDGLEVVAMSVAFEARATGLRTTGVAFDKKLLGIAKEFNLTDSDMDFMVHALDSLLTEQEKKDMAAKVDAKVSAKKKEKERNQS